MRRIFLFGKTKKKIKNLKNLLTFGSECDKVNELLISNESQKSLKSFEKNLKKVLDKQK